MTESTCSMELNLVWICYNKKKKWLLSKQGVSVFTNYCWKNDFPPEMNEVSNLV